jgi:hypothetical protein
MVWVKGIVPHTSGPKSLTAHSHISPTMIDHVSILASHKIATHAKRRAYEELQRERNEEAKFYVQMQASSGYNFQSPEHWEHLKVWHLNSPRRGTKLKKQRETRCLSGFKRQWRHLREKAIAPSRKKVAKVDVR